MTGVTCRLPTVPHKDGRPLGLTEVELGQGAQNQDRISLETLVD